MNTTDKNSSSLPSQLEEGTALTLDFGKLQDIGKGEAAVIPVAVQDFDTKEVLIVAYANQGGADLHADPRRCRILEYIAKRAVGERRHLRRYARTGRRARQLRTELPALPGAPPGCGSLPHQGCRRQGARQLLLSTRREMRQFRQWTRRAVCTPVAVGTWIAAGQGDSSAPVASRRVTALRNPKPLTHRHMDRGPK